MSDVTQLSDEALVDQFATNVFRYETDRTPSPWKEQVDLLEAELLRRLRARSVEGLVGIKTEDLTEALQCMNRSQVLAEFRCREGQIDERTRDRWIAKVQRHIDSMLESAGWSKDRYKSNRAAIGCALQSAAGEGPLIPLADAVRVVEEFFWPDDRTGQRAIAALRALGGGEND